MRGVGHGASVQMTTLQLRDQVLLRPMPFAPASVARGLGQVAERLLPAACDQGRAAWPLSSAAPSSLEPSADDPPIVSTGRDTPRG
jgi:hypothetical protein